MGAATAQRVVLFHRVTLVGASSHVRRVLKVARFEALFIIE
jgi:hypothetical protein